MPGRGALVPAPVERIARSVLIYSMTVRFISVARSAYVSSNDFDGTPIMSAISSWLTEFVSNC